MFEVHTKFSYKFRLPPRTIRPELLVSEFLLSLHGVCVCVCVCGGGGGGC